MRKNHSLVPDLADKIGILGALLAHSLHYYVEQNRVNPESNRNGHCWTYTTLNQLASIYTYAKRSTIFDTLKRMEENGYLLKANFNKRKGDKTVWYALTKKTLEFFEDCGNEKHISEIRTGSKKHVRNPDGLSEIRTTLPITKHITEKTDSNESVSCDFLKRWNALAGKYGFKQNRVMLPDLDRNIKGMNKIAVNLGGDNGWEDYWDNVEKTMIYYTGCTFVKFFTLEYVTRPKKYPSLFEGMIENYPYEKDPQFSKRAETAITEKLQELGKKQSRLDDKLDAARKTKDDEKIDKWVRRCKKVAKERSDLVRQLEGLRNA